MMGESYFLYLNTRNKKVWLKLCYWNCKIIYEFINLKKAHLGSVETNWYIVSKHELLRSTALSGATTLKKLEIQAKKLASKRKIYQWV